MTYLSHSASFHSKEQIAPSNRGIKQFLSYSLLLLIVLYDLVPLPIGHGWRSAAKSGMGTLVIVERHPFPDPGLARTRGVTRMTLDDWGKRDFYTGEPPVGRRNLA